MGKIVRAGAGIFDKLELEPEPELEPDKKDRLRNTAFYSILIYILGVGASPKTLTSVPEQNVAA
jgi:hypothetical protein